MAGLTTLQVKHAKPGRYADGNGLYLHVRDSGSRAWVLRTMVDGRRSDLGLGSVTDFAAFAGSYQSGGISNKAQIRSGNREGFGN